MTTSHGALTALSGAGLPLVMFGLACYFFSFLMWLKTKRKKPEAPPQKGNSHGKGPSR